MPKGQESPCAIRYKACEGPKVTFEVQANGVRTGKTLRTMIRMISRENEIYVCV